MIAELCFQIAQKILNQFVTVGLGKMFQIRSFDSVGEVDVVGAISGIGQLFGQQHHVLGAWTNQDNAFEEGEPVSYIEIRSHLTI